MTPEQLAKMQAGRIAAAAAKKAEAERLAGDEDAQWKVRHEAALETHRQMSAYFERCAQDKHHEYGD